MSSFFACSKVGYRVSPQQCSRRCESPIWSDACSNCQLWVGELKPGQIHVCQKCSAVVFAPFPRFCKACGNGFDQLELDVVNGVAVPLEVEGEEAA